MSGLSQERRDAIRESCRKSIQARWDEEAKNWVYLQEDIRELLDALEAAEARATESAARQREGWEKVIQAFGDWPWIDSVDIEAFEIAEAIGSLTAERDALQAKVNAALKALSSPHASLRRIADARRALTEPEAS